jgi:adenylate kinase
MLRVGALAGAAGLGAAGMYFTGKEKKQPLNLVLFGAPGSGKGTQCDKLKKSFGVRHISSGDVLRDHVKRGTDLGKEAKSYMEAGKLVPDELILNLLKEETKGAANGWLIDGMPRTKVQAEAMDKMGLKPQVFVSLEVADSVLEERITLRRMDPETGDIYHMKFKPPTDPQVAARLTQRKDDTAEALKTRLVAYHDNLNSVKEFYKGNGTLCELDGNPQGVKDGIETVHSNLLTALLKARLPK